MEGRVCLRWNLSKQSKKKKSGCNWIRIVPSDSLSCNGRRYFWFCCHSDSRDDTYGRSLASAACYVARVTL
jgi:hypothetical protein